MISAAHIRGTKPFCTLQARFALAEVALEAIDGDTGRAELVATRGALTFRFADLAEAEAWLAGLATEQSC